MDHRTSTLIDPDISDKVDRNERAALLALGFAVLLGATSSVSALMLPADESLLDGPQQLSMMTVTLVNLLLTAVFVAGPVAWRRYLVRAFLAGLCVHLLFCNLWALLASETPESALIFGQWNFVALAAIAALSETSPEARASTIAFTATMTVTYVTGMVLRPGLPDLLTVALPRMILGMILVSLLHFVMNVFRTRLTSLETESALAKRTASQLAIAMQREREAGRFKDSFLQSMSHELLTPLNTVIGYAHMISKETRGPIGDGCYLNYADNIYNGAYDLQTSVHNILRYVELQDGHWKQRPSSAKLTDYLHDIITTHRRNADNKKVSIRVDMLDDNVIAGDLRLFEIGIEAMLEFALARSPIGGTVEFKTTVDGDFVSVQISDQGRKISKTAIDGLTTGAIRDGLDMPENSLKIFMGILHLVGSRLDGDTYLTPGADQGVTTLLCVPLISR